MVGGWAESFEVGAGGDGDVAITGAEVGVVVGVLLSPWLAGVTPVSEPITYERTPMVSGRRNKEENDSLWGLKGGSIPQDPHSKRTVDRHFIVGCCCFTRLLKSILEKMLKAQSKLRQASTNARSSGPTQFNQAPWQGRGSLILHPIPALLRVAHHNLQWKYT